MACQWKFFSLAAKALLSTLLRLLANWMIFIATAGLRRLDAGSLSSAAQRPIAC